MSFVRKSPVNTCTVRAHMTKLSAQAYRFTFPVQTDPSVPCAPVLSRLKTSFIYFKPHICNIINTFLKVAAA